MLILLFLLAVLLAVILAIVKGFYDGLKDGIKGINRYQVIEVKEDTPYYIEEQIQAILEQIQAYHSIIDRLNENIKITSNLDKLGALEKRKADYLYKTARLEEKLQKMLEKWD